jgi:hypothetical protein
MTLRDDLVINEDFYAVGMATWAKLFSQFGGAPEIPIFQYKYDGG